MADLKQIIDLYTQLAEKPSTDFGWDKGLENAKAHGYKDEWIKNLPSKIWQYCAAVGNPFEIGEISRGSVVLDLGCGAGVDLLVSAYLVGENGRAIGVDITPKMVKKVKEHIELSGFKNVEVLEGSFDNIDIEDESVDFVISNGAINLTSCKESVFKEIYRVLKTDGKIYFADMIDIVTDEASCQLLEETSCCDTEEEDWANCVAGTLKKDELIEIIQNAGFDDVECTGLTHYETSNTTKGATFKAIKISSENLREMHWDYIFKTSDYTQVLWHQNSPRKSLNLIKNYTNTDAKIIDVGCGASLLIDHLLECGYKNITLLDTSKTSLEIVRQRVLGYKKNISYMNLDILNFKTKNKFMLWHDRAVFHFLLKKQERQNYFQTLDDSLYSGAYAIISTFYIGGQTQCAGLDIIQYDFNKMLSELPKSLELICSEEYRHLTPKEGVQKYIYFVIKKL